jgi:hypothetical protein
VPIRSSIRVPVAGMRLRVAMAREVDKPFTNGFIAAAPSLERVRVKRIFEFAEFLGLKDSFHSTVLRRR